MREFNPNGIYSVTVEKNGRPKGKEKIRSFKNEQQLELCGRSLAKKGAICRIIERGAPRNHWRFV